MRKLMLLWLLVPIVGMSQEKNVINVTRVFPKIDKTAEFEKALVAHAAKFHTGDWKWMVSEIQTGPDAGGYSIVEGPVNWDQVDKRGDLGAEHQNDWNKNITIYLTDKYQSSFVEFKEELSNGKLTDYSEKYMVNHVFLKPGMYAEAVAIIKNVKKVWEASNQTVIVYEASASGAPQFAIVTRYKTGLKERQAGFLKPMAERYEAANGAGSFKTYTEGVSKVTDQSWSELLFMRPDLGSK